MWLLTSFGFFAIRQGSADVRSGTLTISGFVRGDLERLRERYLQSLGEIREESRAPVKLYAADAAREAVMVAMLQAAADISYASLPEAVFERQGDTRSRLYQAVWEQLETMTEREGAGDAGHEDLRFDAGLCCAAVLMDQKERVLLRRPAGSLGGPAWTVVAGKLDAGNGREEAVLGAVWEATGYRSRVVCTLAGGLGGEASNCVYLLLEPVGEARAYDKLKTAEVKWVSIRDATHYVEMNRDPGTVRQEKAVLLSAISSYTRINR